MLVVVLLGHTPATAVGVDGFSMEASFDLFYAGLYENSGTSTNQGILPPRILSQIPNQKNFTMAS